MKKIEMAEGVELNKLNIVLRNIQNYIKKVNPDDARLATLRELQQQVQTCMNGTNVISTENLKSIRESVTQDYQNNRDFKSALKEVANVMVERKIEDNVNKAPKRGREAPDETSKESPSAKRVSRSLDKPLSTQVTNAQTLPEKGTTRVSIDTKPQQYLASRQYTAELPKKEDPNKDNILKAFKELNAAYLSSKSGTVEIGFTASEAIAKATKGLSEDMISSPQAVRDFLNSIKPETRSMMNKKFTTITSHEKSILKNFLKTEGVQKAIANDRAIQGAFREAAKRMPPSVDKYIISALPQIEKKVTLKK